MSTASRRVRALADEMLVHGTPKVMAILDANDWRFGRGREYTADEAIEAATIAAGRREAAMLSDLDRALSAPAPVDSEAPDFLADLDAALGVR